MWRTKGARGVGARCRSRDRAVRMREVVLMVMSAIVLELSTEVAVLGVVLWHLRLSLRMATSSL